MNNDKPSSVSLRGSPRLRSATGRSPEDADRVVRHANQMPDELQRWCEERIREARLAANAAETNGQKYARSYNHGQWDVLVDLLEAFPSKPVKASGVANAKLTCRDE